MVRGYPTPRTLMGAGFLLGLGLPTGQHLAMRTWPENGQRGLRKLPGNSSATFVHPQQARPLGGPLAGALLVCSRFPESQLQELLMGPAALLTKLLRFAPCLTERQHFQWGRGGSHFYKLEFYMHEVE